MELAGGAVGLASLTSSVREAASRIPFVKVCGAVSGIAAQVLHVVGLSRYLQLGNLVEVDSPGTPLLAEVIRLERDIAIVKPMSDGAVVALGASVWPAGNIQLWPHESWKGRLIDALGMVIDGGPGLAMGAQEVSVQRRAPVAMSRHSIARTVSTGVRAIDVFTPLCFGQRIGVFAGSGIGKSTLLAMLARSDGFETIVVSLVGERGREVREFVEVALGALAHKAIIVVATGDESAMMRRLAPLSAMAIAEYFRDQGDAVLLIVDSVTRYAHACREVALAAGEQPVARGFPPSVFSDLPRLLERAGPGSDGNGSITGIFSVLVDGDDHNDPVADAIRSTLDGHVVLDRAIAESGRYPAIDILTSISRLAERAWTPDQRTAVVELRKLVARYEESRDLRAVGGYHPGADEELDRAVAMVPRLYGALNQHPDQPASSDAFRDIAEGLSK